MGPQPYMQYADRINKISLYESRLEPSHREKHRAPAKNARPHADNLPRKPNQHQLQLNPINHLRSKMALIGNLFPSLQKRR